MKKKKKFYVVWNGIKPGIYNSWEECKEQVEGFKKAQYKGFFTKEEALMAFEKPYEEFAGLKGQKKKLTESEIKKFGKPFGEAIAVDAAFNGKKKLLEYKGIFIETSTQIFHYGPIEGGSNNIGEFLALVHALAYQVKNKMKFPVYSDSVTAMSWIKAKKCRSKVRINEKDKVFELILRAEKWLLTNDISEFEILKWNSEGWGEIPADFGRK